MQEEGQNQPPDETGRTGDDSYTKEEAHGRAEPSATEKRASAGSTGTTEITPELVQEVGSKLDEFGRSLPEDQQMFVATMIALAGRGLATLPGQVACVGNVRVGFGRNSIGVQSRLEGSSVPKLAGELEAVFCPGKASQFSIEGLEVDKTMFGAKSVAAAACQMPGLAAAKSVASKSVGITAASRFPGAVGSKSVAATAACRNFGMAGSKSVAATAACRFPGAVGSKSVAATALCRNPGLAASKSVAAAAAKSVAAACRTPNLAAAKSVAAAACRFPGAVGSKSVAAACRFPGAVGSKSVAACRTPGFGTQFMSGAFCRG